MNNQLYCPDEFRKALIRKEGLLNGIDYLEVLDNEAPAGSPPQQTILLHCFKGGTGLNKGNVRIEGGVRVGPVGVVWAFPANGPELISLLNQKEREYLNAVLEKPERVLVVRTDSRGDFSTYTLRLIQSPVNPNDPPDGFDPLLSAVEFSFKVECPSDFDCGPTRVSLEPEGPSPQIHYLAKDYSSFRRLILDRLAFIMSDWQERNPADPGMALVELLAYAGDHLSYYQDSVATEAYLGTARRRASVRRHARLVDYFLSDGSNARAWVVLEVDQDLVGSIQNPVLPVSTKFLTAGRESSCTLHPDGLPTALVENPVVFESLHSVNLLKVKRNRIPFYTWRDPDCCLLKGATRATLLGSAAELELQEGDVLIFEEVLGPSGLPEDADPTLRHAVRLNSPPRQGTDPSNGTTVLEISWHAQDALPFSLCLREIADRPEHLKYTTVARANVVLADHGLTITGDRLLPSQVPRERRYRPLLPRIALTHAGAYDHEKARAKPAAAATNPDLRQVLPYVKLEGEFQTWTPQRDLLNSSRFSPEFVLEMESDGRAYLRFGDDVLGREPAPGTEFNLIYRVGNGSAGNVGPGILSGVVTKNSGITRVYNPLPATGGTDPEPADQVRLYAPQAFRIQQRAITAADYVTVAQRHPEVQRAAATRRWTGSWYTWFITVDRKGGGRVDEAFEREMSSFMDGFRLAGYDLEIEEPRLVPLDIILKICVNPDYFRSDVKRALLETFSNKDLPGGRRGFFHPDNFTFGQPVYLSRVIAAAMKVPGVAWVQPQCFQRWGRDPERELEEGRIAFERLEIARLDNDPSAPENGRIDFEMEGGL